MAHYLVYVRRSYVKAGAPDVSEEVQVASVLPMLPAGATHEVIADSDEGQHNSGRTDRRDGYRELIARIEGGRCDGVGVYDLSRLARNARLVLNLHHAMEERRLPLLIAAMPNTRFDTAVGRFMLGQLALTAQFQADLDSERMRTLTHTLFLDGRHRGRDPFGYRSVKDDAGRRLLVPDPDEAAVVRRVWERAGRQSFDEIVADLNRDGIRHRQDRPWTRDAVKDIIRRGRLYLGFVVEKRGLDERPGRHEAIVGESTYRAAMVGLAARRRGIRRRTTRHRAYLLAGLLHCGCGARMRGQTVVSRGREWRYYQCPNAVRKVRDQAGELICQAGSVPADAAEETAFERIATLVLPQRTIDEAREELQRRLNVPLTSLHETQRVRLERRLVNLRKQHAWGDIGDGEYRRLVAETRSELAAIPDSDKLVLFDRNRRAITSLLEAVQYLEADGKRDLLLLLVEYAEARDRKLDPERLVWTPPVRPFFEPAFVMAPPDGCTGAAAQDPLAYYAEASG